MQNLTMDNIAWSSKILSNLKQMCYPQKKNKEEQEEVNCSYNIPYKFVTLLYALATSPHPPNPEKLLCTSGVP